jgi:glycosyltransferase involved in cell wall biosynthesis
MRIVRITSWISARVRLLNWGNVSRGFRFLRWQGPFETLRLLKHLLFSRDNPSVNEEPIVPARAAVVPRPEDLPVELPGVSVVIPVKNAGAGFDVLLQTYKNQTSVPRVELIVVDSGSNDHTREIALRHGATLVTLPAESFSHSTARNLGAARATEDLLLFTVQDAMPPGDDWLSILVQTLLLNDVAAVSCIESPPPGADLFARFSSANHYRNLGLDRQDCILSMPKSHQFMALWQNAQLSNIACLIRRQAFLRYQFKGAYAEDLRLGLDLIRDGYRLAFLSSIGILHAHNRPPFYFLRRNFVNYITVAEIFKDFPRFVPSLETLSPQVRRVQAILASLFGTRLIESGTVYSPAVFCTGMIREINRLRRSRREEAPPENKDFDRDTASFLDWVLQDCPGRANPRQRMVFVDSFLDLIIQMLNLRMEMPGVIDRDQKSDVRHSIFKAFTALLGGFLGACYCFDSRMERKKRDEIMARLNYNI